MVCRILIVEDEEDLLGAYSEALGERYKVLTAPSGKEAIEQAKLQKSIDLAIVDYRLPDMHGTDVVKEIKNINLSTPCIIITAYGDEGIAVQALRCGASDYIKKPFSISELLAKIEAYLPLKDQDEKPGKKTHLDENPARVGSSPPAAVTSKQFHKIQKAVRYIEDNYRTDISFSTAAKEARMSPSYFSRMFRRVMGMSYQEYVNRRRVVKAQDILRNDILSITEIAHSVGYGDITSFGRIFKKIAGCTPTMYRNLPGNSLLCNKS